MSCLLELNKRMAIFLFSRLLNLNTGNIPLEDFFTELVAYLFSTNKGILYAWLEHLELLDASIYSDAYISTQKTFERLERHDVDSRPDIVIELIDGDNRDIIFIESKVGSIESKGQLKRYAEVLNALPGFRNKFLVYVTRDFEPKVKADIFWCILDSNVQFNQFRWHQFYQFLKSQADEMLVEEIIKFMQEYRMAHNNQFSSIDVIALANFTKSLKLMEETMWGEVSAQFKKTLGGIRNQSTAMTQVQLYERYLMTVFLPAGWWCGLGFILKTSNLTDYPTVCLVLEVDPTSPRRPEIIKAMKSICDQNGWQEYELNNSRAWSRIVRERSLQDFLSEEDHISAIRKFFLQSLKELETIQSQYSHLPWGAIKDDGKDPDNSSLVIPSVSTVD